MLFCGFNIIQCYQQPKVTHYIFELKTIKFKEYMEN